ncbi:MAG TPA: alpha/beta fold hydrolase [Actinocrinis sp.]|nr:alpha/beta fold hydrolase [Actinocrinis sp.]
MLLLHGGQAKSRAAVGRFNPALVRMWPFATAIERRVGAADVGIAVLRNRYRGWNGADADPLVDAQWALAQIARRHGAIPVVLVGHSMGGRAALRAGGYATVTSVVALAPWITEGEPVEQLAERDVLIAHAERDRVTDPAASRAYAQRAETVAARVEFRSVAKGDHAMLRGAAGWHRMVASFVATRLAGAQDLRPGGIG